MKINIIWFIPIFVVAFSLGYFYCRSLLYSITKDTVGKNEADKIFGRGEYDSLF